VPQSHRHHYVSQFYLKNFVSDRADPLLFVVDLSAGKQFLTAPWNVALENDFHTIEVDGKPSDVVERMLASFEADVAPVLARVIERAAIADQTDREHLMFFVTLLLIKNPQVRSRINAFTNQVGQFTLKMDAADPDRWAAKMRAAMADGTISAGTDIAQLRELVLADKFTIALAPERMLQLEFTTARSMYPFVAARCWNILQAKEGEFITSDTPAMLMWQDPQRTDPPGFGRRNTRLLVPLSSSVAINGGFELEDSTFALSGEDVAKVNGQVILHARRQIYASSDQFKYALTHNAGLRSGSELTSDSVVTEQNAPA
jgi:hypothetical protein